jgi:hypothetical protein
MQLKKYFIANTWVTIVLVIITVIAVAMPTAVRNA